MKRLTRNEMKSVMGGIYAHLECKATATCSNGTSISCNGYIRRWDDGSVLGCSGLDGSGVTCYGAYGTATTGSQCPSNSN